MTSILKLSPKQIKTLVDGPETGMGFYIFESDDGSLVVRDHKDAFPLYSDRTYYCIDDFVKGVELPKQRKSQAKLAVTNVFANRTLAMQSAPALTISPNYPSPTGAFPLLATVTLPVDTMFLRYISSPTDFRYDSNTKKLSKGTYLTSQLDRNHADTGFGSVGRYSLPLPLPVTNIIE